jgi:hypothetical protein
MPPKWAFITGGLMGMCLGWLIGLAVLQENRMTIKIGLKSKQDIGYATLLSEKGHMMAIAAGDDGFEIGTHPIMSAQGSSMYFLKWWDVDSDHQIVPQKE